MAIILSCPYILQYSAAFIQLSDGNGEAGVIDGHGNGIVEVKVGTTYDSTFDELSEGIESLKLEASAPSHSQLSSRSGSVVSLETRKLSNELTISSSTKCNFKSRLYEVSKAFRKIYTKS